MSSSKLSNIHSASAKQTVNIYKLKDFALTNLPKNWVLRTILLLEPDEMEVSEFVAKIDVWLKLAQVRHL